MIRRSALVVALFLVGCRDHRVIQPTLALPRPGTPVPAFVFTLLDGRQLASTELRARPTVLFLWSTHCPTSRRALADYKTVEQAYGERANIILLSDDATKAELDLLPRVLTDSAIVGRVALARGELGKVFDQSRDAPERDTARISFVLPAYLLLDSNGRVVTRSWGPDAAPIRASLDSLLALRPAI
jgi:hypothetical protein